MIVQRQCILCGGVSDIEVTAEDYRAYVMGAHAQVVWPDWTPDQRELLITGTHPKCWDIITQEEEEE